MKILSFVFLGLISLSAFADRQPFITKVSSTGFMPVEWSRSDKCEVFDTEVLLTRTYGRTSVQYMFPFSSEESLNELIEKAQSERIKLEDNYMCDGPSTVIKARFVVEGSEEAAEVLLYSTGGCGSPKKVRVGPYSSALVDIASTFCPTTH
ncbi:hypothetical protein ACJVC5_07035 [Peredibacter sp. HCB2-198]|uniref:hypothetical protein n=1 Tax=Peredibacter sp. HCB2-198 TaxID=3383025 RepID=UPI0038B5D000